MYYAVKNNHPDILALLLKYGAVDDDLKELAWKDDYREIVDQIALNAEEATERLPGMVETSNSGRVRTLMKQGADPNKTTSRGQTPLCLAVLTGNVAVVKALLQKPDSSKSNRRSSQHQVPRKKKSADTAEYKPTNVDLKNSAGKTPLQLAVSIDTMDVDIVKILIKYGADVSKISLKSALKQSNAASLVPALVKGGVDPNAYTILCKAAEEGDIVTIDILVSQCKPGADVSKKKNPGAVCEHFFSCVECTLATSLLELH